MPFKDKEKAKKKNAEYQKKWFQNNKKVHYGRVRKRIERNSKWIQNYKKTQKCGRCGEDHPSTLDFHHRNNKEKEFPISKCRDYGLKRIKAEIAKCDVLCANCHRKLHWDNKTGSFAHRKINPC